MTIPAQLREEIGTLIRLPLPDLYTRWRIEIAAFNASDLSDGGGDAWLDAIDELEDAIIGRPIRCIPDLIVKLQWLGEHTKHHDNPGYVQSVVACCISFLEGMNHSEEPPALTDALAQLKDMAATATRTAYVGVEFWEKVDAVVESLPGREVSS